MAIEDEVLSRITPTPAQRQTVDHVVSTLLTRAAEKASQKRADLEVMLVGSVAKDTYVQEPDIDIFVLFPTEVERRDLEKIGLEIGQETLMGGEERYAEHPYIRGTWEGLEVDLVPCYHIKDPSMLRSSVDRTPFHTHYIKARLGEQQRGHVRLLKQFMKGVGVYGAEAKVQGFSGYLTEILILKYGTFREVLEAATRWRPGETLTLDGKGKKFDDPFVFYDPVDEGRNVASALSLNSLAQFIYAAREYLKNPTMRFFFPRERCPLPVARIKEIIQERGTELLVIRLDRPDITDDDLYPQLRRTLDGAVDMLENSGFKVYDREFHASDAIRLVIELESATLPRAIRHDGPPAWIKNAQFFLDKWAGAGLSEPFLDNGRWVVMAERAYSDASQLIETRLSQAALGSSLRSLNGLHVTVGEDTINEINKEAISALLDKRKNWEI